MIVTEDVIVIEAVMLTIMVTVVVSSDDECDD